MRSERITLRAYRDVLAIHDAVKTEKDGFVTGWLKQPPKIVDIDGVMTLAETFVHGLWSSWIYPVASYAEPPQAE